MNPENETQQTTLIDVKPSLLRKYFFEYAVLGLTGCVIYLFLTITDLNKFIRTNLQEQRQDVLRAIERNTNAFNENTQTLKEFNNSQKQNHNANRN